MNRSDDHPNQVDTDEFYQHDGPYYYYLAQQFSCLRSWIRRRSVGLDSSLFDVGYKYCCLE
jgi:hypothetical protein